MKRQSPMRPAATTLLLAFAVMLQACTFQPLYGSGAAQQSGFALANIRVEEVDTRVGQQVRNHLIFLLSGGSDPFEPRYLARLRVRDTNNTFAPTRNVRDDTAGSVTVTVSYDLIDSTSNVRIGGGSRIATAAYDRTSQNFANTRAVRDAENRAAREVAELLRLSMAADLGR